MDPGVRRRLLYGHVGEFFRELSVLVMVFGILDSLFRKDARSQVGWVLGSALVSAMAFVLGHWCGAEAAEESDDEQR
jgi:hypothetical protein